MHFILMKMRALYMYLIDISQEFPKFLKNGANGRLNPIVARKLMEIADEIINSLDLDVEVEDVIITGSIASYNWHELSDIDLHIM